MMVAIGKKLFNVDDKVCDPNDAKYQQCLETISETNDFLAKNLSMTNSYITWYMIVLVLMAACYIRFFMKDNKQSRQLCIVAQLISIIGYILTAIFLFRLGTVTGDYIAKINEINDQGTNMPDTIKTMYHTMSFFVVIPIGLALYWAKVAHRFAN